MRKDRTKRSLITQRTLSRTARMDYYRMALLADGFWNVFRKVIIIFTLTIIFRMVRLLPTTRGSRMNIMEVWGTVQTRFESKERERFHGVQPPWITIRIYGNNRGPVPYGRWSEQKFTTHVGVGNSLIEYTMLGLSIDWESLFILIVFTSTIYCGVTSSYRSFSIDHFVNHFTGTEFWAVVDHFGSII